MRYIALLRGINVGSRRVTMLRLRQLLEDLDFTDVSSYINSGNLFFDSESDNARDLQHIIEQKLRNSLGFEVPTFLRTIDDMEAIVQYSPFKDIEPAADTRFCVVFTDKALQKPDSSHLFSSKKDMEIIEWRTFEAYVIWRIINDRPPSGTFTTEVLPAQNTTRFYHTLIKILNAAKK